MKRIGMFFCALLPVAGVKPSKVVSVHHYPPGIASFNGCVAISFDSLPLFSVDQRVGAIALSFLDTRGGKKVASLSTKGYRCAVVQKGHNVTLDLAYDRKSGDCAVYCFKGIKGHPGVAVCFNSSKESEPKSVQRVAIDCGHGGADPGASVGTVAEKNINYAVGNYLADELGKKGVDTFLTRLGDQTVSLDKRVAKIKDGGASLVVSLHVNAALNKSASGFEIYTMHHKLLEPKDGNRLYSYRDNDVQRIASLVQKKLVSFCKKSSFGSIVNRGIKNGVPHILLGSAPTPGILIELGFLTNDAERARLVDSSYQQLLAGAIAQGVCDYLKNEKKS